MRNPAAWGSAFIITSLLASTASAASPQEDLVRDWLRAMSFGLEVRIGSSSFEPSRQAVELESVVIGGPDDLFTVTYPTMTIEDPRRTGDGMFAAHSVRVSGSTGKLRVDPARWFPEFAAALDDEQPDDEPSPRLTPDDDAAENTPGADGPDGLSGTARSGDAQADDGGSDASGDDDRAVTTTVTQTGSFDLLFDTETMLYERLVTPLSGPVIAEDATTVDRVLATMRWTLSVRADWIEANAVTTRTVGMPEGDTESRYTLQFVSGLHDGRMERVGFNELEQTTILDGAREVVRVGNGVSMGLDLAAALDAVDPAAYRNGRGDGIWRTVASSQVYSDISAEFDGGTYSIGSMEATGLRVRQTETPILATLAGYLADPALIENDPGTFIRDIVPGAAGFYGVDAVEMADFVVTGPDDVSFKVGQFEMDRLDYEGIGALTIRDIEGSGGGAGSGRLGMMTFQDIRFGDITAWIDLGILSDSGEPPPEAVRDAILDGSPTLSFFEMTDLSIETPDGRLAIDAFALTEGEHLRALPRRLDLTMTNLSVPASFAGDPAIIDQLTRMGYDELSLSGGMTLAWDTDRGDVRIEDATLVVADMGRLSGDLHLGNLPLSIFDRPDVLEQRLAETTLVSASLVFGNHSIVERTFAMKAEELNQPADSFRKNFAAALPLMLGFLEDDQIQRTFQGALRSFFEDPMSLVVSIRPAAPLPFQVLETMQNEAPGEVLKLLNFKIDANK